MTYSKTHKDQIFLVGAGAVVGGILVAFISKMGSNRNNGNPNITYSPL